MGEDYYSDIKRSFKKLAPFYDHVTFFTSAIRTMVANITKAEKGSKILDIATGTGQQAFAFGRMGYEVIGIDLSEDMLKVARRKNKYKHVQFGVADAVSMPFADSCFGVSSVSFALHEAPRRIRERILGEMVRVTKPGGTILIVDYALPENRLVRHVAYGVVRFYESKYYPQFVNSNLATTLKKHGIEVEKTFSVMLGNVRILCCINRKKRPK